MTVMTSSLAHLSARFPELLEQAASLCQRDQAFRDLCDIHAMCFRGVRRCEASRASALGADYAAQQLRLEAEMVRRLGRLYPGLSTSS